MNGSTAVSLVAAVAVTATVTAGLFLWSGDRHSADAGPGFGRTAHDRFPAGLGGAVMAHLRGNRERGHRGWRDGRGGGWFGRLRGTPRGTACPDDPATAAALADWTMSAARGYLKIGPKQEAEWRALSRAVRAEAERLAPLCAAWQGGRNRPLAARLNDAETALRRTADAIARLRPALDALYRELDPAQRRLFDRMMRHGQGAR